MTATENLDYPAPDAPALTIRYVSSRRWMARAACARSPLGADAWFPEPDSDPVTTAAAVEVCRFRCPVWEECAAYALITGHCSGIAAGVQLGNNRTDNAVALRRELAGADLAPDLETAVDAIVETRLRRRRAVRTQLAAPLPLGALLAEFAPPAVVDRQVA